MTTKHFHNPVTTKTLDLRGFESSIILNARGGTFMSAGVEHHLNCKGSFRQIVRANES